MKPIIRFVSAMLAAGSCLSAHAVQPKLPDPIRIVVPFSPGASNDTFARAISAKLTDKLGVTVIVENKPGAGGSIGAADVSRSKPDGGTILFTSSSFVTNFATTKKLPYDLETGFEPVSIVARGAMVLVVSNETPYQSASQFVDYIKHNKGKMNYGSAGVGSIGQLSSELLNARLNTSMLHIPYKGISNAVTDMVGGRLDAMITTPASVSGQLSGHMIRPLAVTSKERSKFFPDLPTLAELVPGYSVDVWWGMYVPAGTPKTIVDALNESVREVSHTSDMKAMFAREATEPTDLDAAQATVYVKEELQKWRKVATERHIVAGM